MMASALETDEIVVHAGYFQKSNKQANSSTEFSYEEIRRAPGSTGDVSCNLMTLPSIAKVNDQRNNLIVRGGNPIENTFYIDNIEIPNINHFPNQGSSGGPIGLVNVDFIQDVTFFSGGFWLVYGDKLFSIMDISFRKGNRSEFDGQLGLNFAGFGGAAEGPMFKDKGSWLFSARRSYLDFWLRNITLILTFVLCVFLLENLLLLVDINLCHYFSMTSYLAGFAIYLVGYLGLLKSEVFSSQAVINFFHRVSENNFTGPKKEDNRERQDKYVKSGLSSDKAKGYLDNLVNIMEIENIYMDSNLTLNQIANKLGIFVYNLSEVINTQKNQNFFNFINKYRIEKVKKDLTDPAKSNLKILSIAFEAGFNSKASFNTIFEKFSGLTTSDYRNKTPS